MGRNRIATENIEDLEDPFADHGIARKLFGSSSPVPEEEEEDPVAERRFYCRFIGAGGIPKNLFGSLRIRSDIDQSLNGSPLSMVGLKKLTSPLPSGGQGRARFPIYPNTPLHEIQRRRDCLRELLISLWNDMLESPNPKKLLNAIDFVEKAVMKEIRRIQSTPSAKEAERKRKVSTLMSMRLYLILKERVLSKLEKRKLNHVKDMGIEATLRRSYR